MPTYEYECQNCHERIEAVQKFSDAPLTVCPLCGGELRKVFSSVGIVFKGSGFYKNDSRQPASSSASNSSSASTSESSVPESSSAPAAASPAPSTTTTPTTPAASSD